jgi:hypothetical protein
MQHLLAQARRTIRAWTAGDLRHDALTTPLKYAPAPCGRLIAPVNGAMLEAVDCALAIPDEHSPSLDMAVSLAEFEPLGAAESNSDRWKIYHGVPPFPRWALIDIDMARFQGAILDGSALQHSNPLAAVEPRVCGSLNRGDERVLPAAIERCLGVQVESPRAVGLDPLGLDIRTRFDVLRINFPTPLPDPATAEAAVLSWIGGA